MSYEPLIICPYGSYIWFCRHVLRMKILNDTENINIRKGVKQGCPLNPTLFKIAIDPLLRYINSRYGHLGYKYDEEHVRTLQAYADDLLLFSKNLKDFQILIDAIIVFMNYAKIAFNPKKCFVLYHDRKAIYKPAINLPDENGELQAVQVSKVTESIRYLGTPLSTRKMAKVKFNARVVDQGILNLTRVVDSGLKFNQIVHAVRTFIQPSFDFAMTNSQFRIMDLQRYDKSVKNQLNNIIGKPALSSDLFYVKWNDGGIGLRKIE
jgi:hypothetical protein